MGTLSVVYFSGTGHTTKMAKAVANEANKLTGENLGKRVALATVRWIQGG